jgi:hypothetical protein
MPHYADKATDAGCIASAPVLFTHRLDAQRRPRKPMNNLSAISEEKKEPGTAPVLCWTCNRNEANCREHKTKRSDLLAVLGSLTQESRLHVVRG